MLSKYCTVANEYGIKVGGVNKLVPNLGNKSKYVLHYGNLPLHLSLGMKLTKVHRILKCKQSDCLKNTLILIQTKEKMLLIVLKRTMKNLRKIINVRLVNNTEYYIRYTSKPSFVLQKMFYKHFVAIYEIKPV